MKKIFDTWQGKVIAPLAIVVVASIATFAATRFNVIQTASVNSASCYFQSEIDSLSGEKAALESDITNLTNELAQISSDIVSNSEKLNALNPQIDALNAELVSDYDLQSRVEQLNELYTEIDTLKSLSSLEVQSREKSAEVQKLTNAASDLVSKIASLQKSATVLSAQVQERQVLETSNANLVPMKAKVDLLLQQEAEAKAIDDTSTAMAITQTAANKVQSSKTAAGKAEYKTLSTKYTELRTKLSNLTNAYLKKYKVSSVSLRTVTTARNTEQTKYNTALASFNTLRTTYSSKYANDTRTYADLSAAYIKSVEAYNLAVEEQKNANSAIAEQNADITRLRGEYSTRSKSYLSDRGYRTLPILNRVEGMYHKLQGEYDMWLTRNSEIKDEIAKLEEERSGYENAITAFNTRSESIQGTISSNNSRIGDLTTTIYNAGTNICPAYETSCNNNIDDDRNGIQDCDDSACATDIACVKQEICNNGVDDDNNGAVDCNDSECAYNVACTSGEICDDGIDNDRNNLIDCGDSSCDMHPNCRITPGEICDDGIDNNANGLADCADSACSSLDICKSEPAVETCDDGIDNNANGQTDCEEVSCSMHSACICEVKDENGVILGTCAEFGVDKNGNIDGSGRGVYPIIENSNDCSAGTVPVPLILGHKTFYQCKPFDDGCPGYSPAVSALKQIHPRLNAISDRLEDPNLSPQTRAELEAEAADLIVQRDIHMKTIDRLTASCSRIAI